MRILGVITTVLALVLAFAVGGTFATGVSDYEAALEASKKKRSSYERFKVMDRGTGDAYALAPVLAAGAVSDQKRSERTCRRAHTAWKKRKKKHGTRSKRTSKAKKTLIRRCKKATGAFEDLSRQMALASLLIVLGSLIAALGGVLAALRKGRIGGALIVVGAVVPVAAGVGPFLMTVVFALLGALLFLLGVLAARRPTATEANQSSTAPGPGPDGPTALVVLRDSVTYKRLSRVLGDLGFEEKGGLVATAPLIPGEPEIASWVKANTLITYSFDPVVYYRELSIKGPDLTPTLVASRLAVADADTVRKDLDTADEAARMRGLMTARSLGLTAFTTDAERLTHSSSKHVSNLARRALEALEAKGGVVAQEETPAGPLDPTPTPDPPPRADLDAPEPEPETSGLVPRSMEEKFLYMELHPCPTCGDTRFDRSHRLVARGQDMISVEGGPCVRCGTERSFEFVAPQEPLMQGSPTETYGGEAPSTIIDPGQFLALSDTYAKRTHPPPEQLDAAGRKQAHDDLMRAIVAMEEVLKFIGPGAMEQPHESVFFSDESARMRAEMPGQFKRYRLEARLGTYKRIAKMYE